MTLTQEHSRYLASIFITILASQATMVVDAAFVTMLSGPAFYLL